MLAAAAAGLAALAVGVVGFTLWAQRWGANDAECSMPMAGDEFLDDASATRVRMTRAITIEAPPKTVWPWLAQLGRGAGWYSYDFLDNASKMSARHIVSWVPAPAIGDASPIGYLRHIAPGAELTWWIPRLHYLGSDVRAVFDILLRPDGTRSRLVIRFSAEATGAASWLGTSVIRFLDSVMAGAS